MNEPRRSPLWIWAALALSLGATVWITAASGELIPQLLIPIGIAALPLVIRSHARAVHWLGALLMGVFVALSLPSLGWFFAPAFGALVVAAFARPGDRAGTLPEGDLPTH